MKPSRKETTKMTIETLTLIERTLWGSAAAYPLALGLWRAFGEWRAASGIHPRMFAATLKVPRLRMVGSAAAGER
jgi:hypothetical protein